MSVVTGASLIRCLRAGALPLVLVSCSAPAGCKTGEEARVEVAGPSIRLTADHPEEVFHAHGCVLKGLPDEGLWLEVNAEVTAVGGNCSVELYVEQGNAFFDIEDGTTEFITVRDETGTFSEMTGITTWNSDFTAPTPELEAFCSDDPIEIRFRRVAGDVDATLEWHAILAAQGGGLDTRLELRLER